MTISNIYNFFRLTSRNILLFIDITPREMVLFNYTFLNFIKLFESNLFFVFQKIVHLEFGMTATPAKIDVIAG